MDVFTALGDPTRRSIIELLASRGNLAATDIYKRFPVSHPAISQHLKVLRDTDLVTVEKQAQQRIYTVNPKAMDEVERWVTHMIKLWNQRFDRLDELLAKEKIKTFK